MMALAAVVTTATNRPAIGLVLESGIRIDSPFGFNFDFERLNSIWFCWYLLALIKLKIDT